MPSIVSSIVRSIVRPVVHGGGGASAPAMPDGAIGIWYADEYQATPRRAIPNSVSDQPVSQNLLTFPFRRFDDTNFWNKQNTTVTDGSDESTINLGAGDSYCFPANAPVLTAGDYTLCVTARRNGGTDQGFRISFLQAGVDSGTFTATDTNQDFSFTATCGAGAQTILALRTVGGLASSLIVSRIALYAGTEDIGEPAEFGGHLILGDNHFDSRPAVSSGVADMAVSGAYGLAQWQADLALSEYTVLAVGQRTNDSATYSAIMGNISYASFVAMADNQKSAWASFGGQQLYDSYSQVPQGLKLLGEGFRVIGHRFGDRRDFWINDTRLISAPSGGESLPASVFDLIFSGFAGPGNTGGYEYAAIALYDRALTDTEYRDAYAALTARVAESAVTVETSSRFMTAVGDSITAPTDSYANLYATNANPKVFGSIHALAGNTLVHLEAGASVVDSVIPPSPAANKYILTVMIGTNDLTGPATVEDYLDGLSSYIADRLAAGWTDIVLCTLLPTTGAPFLAKRGDANTGIRAMAASNIYICDMAADTTMGEDGDASNTTYYADGIHPTATGQALLETIFRAVVDAI